MSLPLTADLIAAAVVASARSYGDHPIRAFEAKAGPLRRSLAPAIGALAQEGVGLAPDLCRIIGVNSKTYYGAAKSETPAFQAAYSAAARAIRKAQPAGMVVAPPPVGLKTPRPAPRPATTPAPAKPAVDHTSAIKQALARRQAAAVLSSPDTCAWPKGGSGMIAEDPCGERAVQGRLYCPAHCRRLGQKDTPVLLGPAEMPARYTDRATG